MIYLLSVTEGLDLTLRTGLLEVQAFFGHLVQLSPDKAVKAHYKNTHHADTKCDSWKIAGGRHFCDVAA